jgi:hypothetical protein
MLWPAGRRPQDSPHEQAEHRDHARMIIGKSIAKRVRQAQHPLANRHARDHAIDDVLRNLAHQTLVRRRMLEDVRT